MFFLVLDEITWHNRSVLARRGGLRRLLFELLLLEALEALVRVNCLRCILIIVNFGGTSGSENLASR